MTDTLQRRMESLIRSLPLAIATAIQSRTKFEEMNLDRWAQSYNCSVGEVVQEWQRQINSEEIDGK